MESNDRQLAGLRFERCGQAGRVARYAVADERRSITAGAAVIGAIRVVADTALGARIALPHS